LKPHQLILVFYYKLTEPEFKQRHHLVKGIGLLYVLALHQLMIAHVGASFDQFVGNWSEQFDDMELLDLDVQCHDIKLILCEAHLHDALSAFYPYLAYVLPYHCSIDLNRNGTAHMEWLTYIFEHFQEFGLVKDMVAHWQLFWIRRELAHLHIFLLRLLPSAVVFIF
jgi:hypothetical protein